MFHLFDLLIFGNIWIALGAGLMYISITHLLTGEIIIHTASFQVFGASLFAYNFLRFKSINHQKFQSSPIAKWMTIHKRVVYFLMISGLLFVLIPFIFNTFSFPYYSIWSAMFILTLCYLPFRKYWWLKTFFVALVWTLTTVILPLVSLSNFDLLQSLFLAFGMLFFYLSITLPFEIRDMKYDQSEHPISNFALRFGLRATKTLSIFLSFIAFVLCIFYSFWLGVLFIPILLLSLTFIIKSKTESSEYLFTFGFDGLIVLFAIFLLL